MTENIKLLDYYKEQWQHTYLTLEGRKVLPNSFDCKMYNFWQKEIDILTQTISGQNKTKLRREAKDNPYLMMRLKQGELNHRKL